MSSSREIITLQFGNYANYVGAHFWNIQELSFDYTGSKTTDINHDVLYREGAGSTVTYTPRLLLAELRHELGSLPASGGLNPKIDQVEAEVMNWTNVETKEEPPIEKNDYLKFINNEIADPDVVEKFNFEENVKTWTDLLFPRFHQRTISSINSYRQSGDQNLFNVHLTGNTQWKSPQFSDTFTDNIRRYSEECDNLQGFQILLNADDGFGGLANSCLIYLCDEYPNKCKFNIPLLPAFYQDNEPTNDKERDVSNLNDSTRLVNLALTLDGLFENSTLFVPMCCSENGWRKPGNKRQFYNVDYNHKLNYHTSAIIASALDTITYSYRLKDTAVALSDLCSDMTGYGRKMAAASLGLPFHMQEQIDLIDHLDKLTNPMFIPITPSCTIPQEKLFQHVTVRGIPEKRLKQTLKNSDRQIKMEAYRCESVKEMFEFYFQCNYYASASYVTASPIALEVKTPYPKIFHQNMNRNGFVKEFVDDDKEVERVPIIAGLHNGNFLFDTLEKLCREAKRVKISKLHRFGEEGLEADDYSECLSKIAEVQSNYEDNYEL